ncbi:transcription factor SCREAM2-like [Salvia miltiorrhiza]|uniref:transcription factor SCREAM2-like n=1 Tax=Salvia miltiorrhiza TaxID=226208 RepID=UPI0025AC64F1|nr:transcription factor SCREAM2-like [Salvia miltiorrhiza]
MVSREHKKDALHDKLQILRSITHSHAINDTSIVLDASNYIKELKHKVEILNEEIATTESSTTQNMWPRVSVETLEKGFLVNVHSGRSCPGLLVSILATFEELGLNVLEARVSCGDNFHLQALGGDNEEDEESMDAQTVKRTITNAIKNWSGSIE